MATKVIKKITKKNQGELQGKINSSYTSENPSKYYASYIETEDGKVCLVAKPLTIEKNFCFAEGRTRDISEAIELAKRLRVTVTTSSLRMFSVQDIKKKSKK